MEARKPCEITFLRFNEEKTSLQEGSEWALNSVVWHLSTEKAVSLLTRAEGWGVKTHKDICCESHFSLTCRVSHTQNLLYGGDLPGLVGICLLLKWGSQGGKQGSAVLSTCCISLPCSPSALSGGVRAIPRESNLTDLIQIASRMVGSLTDSFRL